MTAGRSCTVHRRRVVLEGVAATLPGGRGTVIEDKGDVLTVRMNTSGRVRDIPRDSVTVHRAKP